MYLIGLHGLPTATQLFGISFTTTLPAPITTLFPIFTLPIIVTFTPRVTLSPITGRFSLSPSCLLPIVVKCLQEKFLPIDLYKSHATKFQVEGDYLRPPLNSIAGLGTVAAESIMKARNEEKFMSIDDMKIRAKIGDSVTELLRKFGCLEGMSQSNQMSLFG